MGESLEEVWEGMNRAFRMIYDTYWEKILEGYILDEERDPIEAMKLVWETEDTHELRARVHGSHLRPGVTSLCLRALDIFDVRRELALLPKGGPYRTW